MRQSLSLASTKLTFRHTVNLAFVPTEGGYFSGKLKSYKFGGQTVLESVLSFGGSVTTTYLTEENIYMLLRLSGWTYPASASVQ